jgi:hypothetical protein
MFWVRAVRLAHARALIVLEEHVETMLSVRDYALQRGLTLHTVYMKLWGGQLQGVKRDGRWQILVRRTVEGVHDDNHHAPGTR